MPRSTNKEELPNVDIILTKEEREALREVKSAEARWLYLEISFRRDFATNISGETTKINDGAFKESLSYKGSRGKKSYKPSSTHIMRWLDQLEDVGLIKRLGNHVFYLPLAPTEESVKILSHQFCHQYRKRFVTGFVTNEENEKQHIYIQKQEEKKEGVTGFVTKTEGDLSQQVDTPLIDNNNNDNVNTRARNFFEVLKNKNYPETYLVNKKTIAMIKTWERLGITPEEAETAIKLVDSAYKNVVRHPTYYLEPVIQYKQDLAAANTKAEKVKNEPKRTETHQQHNSTRKVSATESYWNWSRRKSAETTESG